MLKIILSVIFALLVLVPKVIFAQELTYQRAYQDYTYNLSSYTKAHDKYILKKSAHIQYQTLTTEQEAIDATKEMLKARDETIKCLLTAIRTKIKENNGLSMAQKETLYSKIDPEVLFFQDHKSRVDSVISLDDLADDSDEAKDRYDKFTEKVIYSSLIEVSAGNMSEKRGKIYETLNQLKSKYVEIRNDNPKDIYFESKFSGVDKFFVDIENKLARSSDKDNEAKGLIYQDTKYNQDFRELFNEASSPIQGSYLYLKEATSNLEEILWRIKTY